MELGAAQLADRDGWWMFGHVGIARAQNVMPKGLRRPYAVLLCGIEVWDPSLAPDRKKALKSATSRIAISKFTADLVAAAHPDVGRISVCPLALLPRDGELTVYDRDIVAQVAQPSLLIAGRMSGAERYKGHDELLECWPIVLHHLPKAQLVIVGRGDDTERLRAKAGELGIAGSVLFTGFVSDATLEAVRKRVNAFALPSRGEGFGLVYLEAMRAGLPCIGGVEDAARDVIVDGKTGLLVDPRNGAELALSVLRLLQSPELSAIYGAAGKRRFEEVFTFQRYCERLRTVLESDLT
ncbi:MAG TPA: glycosyltransferase family 4 protein [Gemmatimonadaceae bacterium]|nr:glycosyltransferase family 4 protein [Gemmatimonadaceae bacterium]